MKKYIFFILFLLWITSYVYAENSFEIKADPNNNIYKSLDKMILKNPTYLDVLPSKIDNLLNNIDENNAKYNLLKSLQYYFDSKKNVIFNSNKNIEFKFENINYQINRITKFWWTQDFDYWPLIFPKQETFLALVYNYSWTWSRYDFFIQDWNNLYFPVNILEKYSQNNIDWQPFKDENWKIISWKYTWQIIFDLNLSTIKNWTLYISNKWDDVVDDLFSKIWKNDSYIKDIKKIRIWTLNNIYLRNLDDETNINWNDDFYSFCKTITNKYNQKMTILDCNNIKNNNPYKGLSYAIFKDIINSKLDYKLEVSTSNMDKYCLSNKAYLKCVYITDNKVWDVSTIYK